MMDKFGRTLMFLFFVLLFILGAKMLLKVSDPLLRKLSPSLADTLKNI